jgi:hypothetical protein
MWSVTFCGLCKCLGFNLIKHLICTQLTEIFTRCL